MTLRYMIIGAGGTGAPLGAFLAKNGADVTLIARGAHLAAMQEKGLRFEQSDGEIWTVPVKAFDMDGFLAAKAQGAPSPDVIFVCVKGYSLDDTIPFIRSAAGEKTVVIPILNIYGTGRTIAGAASRSARDRRLHLHLVQSRRSRRDPSVTARSSA
ncbi:ketopantoate reductase family protein [Agathobaculum sp.]|uniref:ketopantoate reductase family protein n=1 Tax=Agathobaculum sp. TaxID=2048138 RepID=UPI003522D287